MNSLGPVDTLVQKFKLLKGGKTLRFLFRNGIVDENGVATKLGRTLARRLMAEQWVTDNSDRLATDLGKYAKVVKDESEDDE